MLSSKIGPNIVAAVQFGSLITTAAQLDKFMNAEHLNYSKILNFCCTFRNIMQCNMMLINNVKYIFVNFSGMAATNYKQRAKFIKTFVFCKFKVEEKSLAKY